MCRWPRFDWRLPSSQTLYQFFTVGQAQQGTVNSKEPMPTPSLNRVLWTIGHRQHAVLIQFDEGTVFELGPSMSHRSTGERFKEGLFSQLIEELVQMALNGFEGFLEEENHEDWKSQLALAREVLWPHPMTS